MSEPALALEDESGGTARSRPLRRGPLTKTPFLIMLYTVDSWNWFLCFRQLKFVVQNGIPAVLEGHVSQNDYNRIRMNEALISAKQMTIISYRLCSYSTGLFKGAATNLWQSTGKLTDDPEFRTILWVLVNNLAGNLSVVPIIVIRSSLQENPSQLFSKVAVIGGIWLILRAVVAAIETFIMMKVTNRYGPRIIIPLSVLKEIFKILLGVAYVLEFCPAVFVELPTGPHKSEIDAVTKRAGYEHGVYMNPSVNERPSIRLIGAFGASIIVVTKALLEVGSPRDVAALVAHELGHWNGFHYFCEPLGNLLATAILTQASVWSYGNNEFINLLKFDPMDPPHPYLGVLLFKTHLYPPIHNVIMGLKNTGYYFCGYAADNYASRMGFASELVNALVIIFQKVLHFPHGDPWYSAWTYAHPNTVQRIESINELKSSKQ